MSAAAVTGRRALLAALALSIAVSFTGVFDHSLRTPDEPRVAAIGREMLVSGDYVLPTTLTNHSPSWRSRRLRGGS